MESTAVPNDAKILKICADLKFVERDSAKFEMLISDLADLSPATAEGARAQALAALPLLQDGHGRPSDALIRLIKNVVARMAGITPLH